MPPNPSPFDPLPQSVPVTVLTRGDLVPDAQTAVIILEPALHDHVPGTECIACAARSDIRAMLFDLLTSCRRGDHAPFDAVLIDARAIADPQPIIDRLRPGVISATGLRDHTIARSFHLKDVL